MQNNFLDVIKSLQEVFFFLNGRMLSLEGTLGTSKNVYLTFLTVIPNSVMKELQKIYKTFICPRINLKTLCKYFENGGLSSKCSWLRKLLAESFHE